MSKKKIMKEKYSAKKKKKLSFIYNLDTLDIRKY